jgi:hypothetical protein
VASKVNLYLDAVKQTAVVTLSGQTLNVSECDSAHGMGHGALRRV